MSAAILETKNLTHIYQKGTGYELKALDNVSISINKGELVGIIGHTGSGKSTLIEHFNAILKPTSGTVLLGGEDIWKDKSNIRQVRFKVGVCFQYPEYQLFEESVYKDIAFGPKNMGLSDGEIDQTVRRAAAYVGIDESYFEKSPFDLSGGEKRRVAIAGIMAMSPQVLVLDEPCAGLDPIGRKNVLRLLQNYRRETGSTVVLVSHSMEDMSRIADRIIVMNKARVEFFDCVDKVFSRTAELYSMGLSIPEITRLFLILKEKGYDVSTDIYTQEKALEEILRLIKSGGGKRC